MSLIVQEAHQDKTRGKEFHGTREEWCEAIAARLIPQLEAVGIQPIGDDRQVRFAIAPLGRTTLGVCYGSSKSVDGDTNLITINSDADSMELTRTLIHELLHAFDDCKSGHRGRWKKWAETIGISRCGHDMDGLAEQMCQEAFALVGEPVKHRQTQSKDKQRPPSQVKFECLLCGLHIHMPARSALMGHSVDCHQCDVEMIPDLTAFTSGSQAGDDQSEQPSPEEPSDQPDFTVAECRKGMQRTHPDQNPDADPAEFQLWVDRLAVARAWEKLQREEATQEAA